MMETIIIDRICTSCGCDKETAWEYLDAEVRNLRELRNANDLREDDLESACDNLGIKQASFPFSANHSFFNGHQLKINFMGYFQNINSLAELKKSYRILALQNHPDKGGCTETMQQINLEFERLFAKWKDDTTVSAAASGYENDYAGASANEYTEYVYNEYRWKGRNYNGQMHGEIVEIIRKWLKETYPRYKFSATQNGYRSINIYLVKADFEAFTKESGLIHKNINHYHIGADRIITERACEVMLNVRDFTMSYNYDNSDIMTDYFDTNFYLTLGIGRYDKPYQTELPKLQTKEKLPEVFKHPEGAAHKAIRQALGKARFDFIQSRANAGKLILGEDTYGAKGEHYFWPKQYSSAKTAQKRIDKLAETGMRCRPTGYNGGCIEFLGYTPETEARLEQERQEYSVAHRQWQTKRLSTN